MYRIDAATFQVGSTVDLPAGEGYAGFTEVDPATGAVWVGLDTSVVVHDATGQRVRVLKGTSTSTSASTSAGTVGGTGTTPAGGGALATTGTAVATAAGAAVVLTAAGWTLFRRGRREPTA